MAQIVAEPIDLLAELGLQSVAGCFKLFHLSNLTCVTPATPRNEQVHIHICCLRARSTEMELRWAPRRKPLLGTNKVIVQVLVNIKNPKHKSVLGVEWPRSPGGSA
jgi:DUF1365 family protein